MTRSLQESAIQTARVAMQGRAQQPKLQVSELQTVDGFPGQESAQVGEKHIEVLLKFM